MYCLILAVSPGKRSNPMKAAEAVASSLEHEGHKAELVWINDNDAGFCVACEHHCNREWPGFCYHKKTPMDTLGDKIIAADRIIFITPTCSWYYPIPLKALINRIVISFSDYYGKAKAVEVWSDKKVALAAVCPFSNKKEAVMFNKIMLQHCKSCHITPIDTMMQLQDMFPLRFLDRINQQKITTFTEAICQKEDQQKAV